MADIILDYTSDEINATCGNNHNHANKSALDAITAEAVTRMSAPIPPQKHVVIFSTGHAPNINYDSNGVPTVGVGLGFYNIYDFTSAKINIESDGTIDMANNDNKQISFSAPFNCTVDSVTACAGCFGDFTTGNSGAATVKAALRIYKAPATGSIFTIAGEVESTDGWTGASVKNTIIKIIGDNLGITINRGERILLLGVISGENDNAAQNYYIYFGGSAVLKEV